MNLQNGIEFVRFTRIYACYLWATGLLAGGWILSSSHCMANQAANEHPNILFILTDDQRWDVISTVDTSLAKTPQLQRIFQRGTRFENAFVTLAICSPSRAACLTGRYGSSNGVTTVGKSLLNSNEQTFAQALREVGYATGVTGKWHLGTTPEACGFEFASTCWSNGTWYDREFKIDGESKVVPGFVDDVIADESIRFIRRSHAAARPFVLWMNTQAPHMDDQLRWPVRQDLLASYPKEKMRLPQTWNDSLDGKPDYLRESRNRTQALAYGYDDPDKIRQHASEYYAAVEQMDSAVGRVLDELDQLELSKDTWILFMGDNGWFLGEHGMTSKVLAYEESIRVPMAIAGPGLPAQVSSDLVLNIDLTSTIYELAGLPRRLQHHGRSLLPIVQGQTPSDWRESFLYEAPSSQLGSKPLWAVRDNQWKYIQSDLQDGTRFRELYQLDVDPNESMNVAELPGNSRRLEQMMSSLRQHQEELRQVNYAGNALEQNSAPNSPRTDLQISGIYPHLTTYGVYSQGGAHDKPGHNECGIGALVPWAGKLWMVNYAPHMPKGSEHKLYSISPDLHSPLTIHPESVGGTPAGRMIHGESNQLLIGHYAIDAQGTVRAITPSEMPIRITAIARHLSDPSNYVYYVDMEGSIWEANVHTLAVRELFKKPVPGWHSKGGYTSQGRLIVSNNGELHVGDYQDLLVGGVSQNEEERGVLAEWDGLTWRIVERRQFTEVTGPNGISGGSDGQDPVWAVGWDKRSLRLKLLEKGTWHTYLLPKAAYCNDASHGWYTEWPRIREITDGRWMMDMHGMFFDFPPTFSSANSSGLRPIGSHLRYVPDFCGWNGQLVLATDETSIQGNPLAGQPQSNLWFGSYDDLGNWGPASAYGGPWLEDQIQANIPSDPFLVAGFDRRVLHLATGKRTQQTETLLRASDQQEISDIPEMLAVLPRVTIPRGDWHQPSPGYDFEVNQPVTVYLAVDERGAPQLPPEWQLTEHRLTWGRGLHDRVYRRSYAAGAISIPGNDRQHAEDAYGMPHTAFVLGQSPASLVIAPQSGSRVNYPATTNQNTSLVGDSVVFTLQVDKLGNGEWEDYRSITIPQYGYQCIVMDDSFDGVWLRLRADHDCIATAFLHQTSNRYHDGNNFDNRTLFQGLADVHDPAAYGGLVYAAQHNRNLRLIFDSQRYYEFTKDEFNFQSQPSDASLLEILQVQPEFSVDQASVVLVHHGRVLRLPKGPSRFDQPFAVGWPRMSREVESERHLANIHGTFYEVPLVTNGAPPAWNLMRPVASHSKQITDYCSWNGLLVLAGLRSDALADEHVFVDPAQRVGLWFGGIDDLWRLGKPMGIGGPWYETSVQAEDASDPYLMTGYDQKTLRISHRSQEIIRFTVQVDITGNGFWVEYLDIEVPPNQIHQHVFPSGFSANWLRVVSHSSTTATAQLEYK
ncbi:MAG: sulfatase-like hydrolase/transferase [Planctomycetales bacterium]|nr:sulfatase-like hydrolase/transferase [Planctomycetales bacterium]